MFGLVISCGSQQRSNENSAHVVVEYEGKVVNEYGGYYLTLKEFEQRLNDKNLDKLYILFMDDRCSSCLKVKDSIKRFGWQKHITMLDMSRPWVSGFAKEFGISGVPTLVAVEKGKKDINIYSGPFQVMIYLSGKLK